MLQLMEQNETFNYFMLYDNVHNSQQKKYGVEQIEDISRDGINHGFKRICNIYETIVAMAWFFL